MLRTVTHVEQTQRARFLKAWLLAGMLGISGAVVAQSRLPDAQVEANVLKLLATAPQLADEAITTQTVYGTVTLTGSVRNEAARRIAETLTANADGVKKVVDELRISEEAEQVAMNQVPPSHDTPDQGAAPLVLQSDGTYAPATAVTGSPQVPGQKPTPGSAPADRAQRNNPEADQQMDLQREQQQNGQPQTLPGQAPVAQGSDTQAPPSQGQNGGGRAGQPPHSSAPYGPYGRRPMYNPNYPQYPYPSNGGPQQGGQAAPGPVAGGQEAGESVVIPPGVMIRVRINQPLSSNRSQPGSTFDGIVANDVVAGNLVAIPRGAAVQGKVIDAKGSGVLKGRGEMQVQLTSVTLGGRSFPIVSDIWNHHGGDKTIETINKTAGFGAGGAVIGALAGGGAGAAIGGGIGAALGLGSSAASGNGQVYIPSEAMLTFHTAAPATVTTVSEQEMQRLAYGVPAGAEQRAARRPYPRVYVGPGYPYPYPRYPGPYGPYGYPNY